jgi:hypothetical protein
MKLDPMERLNMGISAGAIVATFAIATPHFASSLAIGAALEAMNFRFLHGSARALFAGVLQTSRGWLVIFALRFAMLGSAIIVAMSAGADPVGLTLGLSLVMPALLIYAVWNRPAVIDYPAESVPSADDPSWDEDRIWNSGVNALANEDEE